MKSVRQQILEKGIELTTGDRNDSYGDPKDSHQIYADLFNTYIEKRYGRESKQLDAHDIAIYHALQKIGRIANDPHHADNYVDAATYTAIAGEIAERMRQDDG